LTGAKAIVDWNRVAARFISQAMNGSEKSARTVDLNGLGGHDEQFP